jgi:hypothetical protein
MTDARMSDDELTAAINAHLAPLLQVGDLSGARRFTDMILEGEHPVEVDGWLIPDGRVAALDDDDRCWLLEPDPDGGLPWLAIVRHGHIVGAGRGSDLFTATIDALHTQERPDHD